jgi:hypothetical protein
MHPIATSFQDLAASAARCFLLCGRTNNRANNNAIDWRALA